MVDIEIDDMTEVSIIQADLKNNKESKWELSR